MQKIPTPSLPIDRITGEIIDLHFRKESLATQVDQCERGDEDKTEIYEVALRGKPVLVRKELRTHINRSAATAYWREIRETEANIRRLQQELEALEQASTPSEVTVKYAGGPDDPRNAMTVEQLAKDNQKARK